jgi:hypothetical protein
VFGVIAASSSAAFPNSTILNPGVNGPNPSRYCSSVEKLTSVVVRPWKLFAATTISARSWGTPFFV